ncbi:type II secretion system GspH family protein [Stutzerimonas stutzeri]|uniref:type II secretion system protein n=1 Tax=Stutzerimonas stutzeri TaxID=316 RepID=UPI00244CDB0A|nr:type II secretion system protein [Stutzerimonas stutzeri]MDH0609809.1 type II secretion system GspH family protein [Stutzerimonas stutzeri]
MIQKHRRRNQKGFTLVEVLITIILIGVIASMVYPLVNNFVSSKANAQEMMSVAQNIVRSASLMNQTMRAPTTVTSNPLTASGNSLLDAVIMGDKVNGIISSTYAPRYATSGIRPMSDAVTIASQPAVGSAGSYKVGDSEISLLNISSRQMGVQFTNVPTELVQEIFLSREGGTFNGATARTVGVVRYSAVSGGTHATVTLVYDL